FKFESIAPLSEFSDCVEREPLVGQITPYEHGESVPRLPYVQQGHDVTCAPVHPEEHSFMRHSIRVPKAHPVKHPLGRNSSSDNQSYRVHKSVEALQQTLVSNQI